MQAAVVKLAAKAQLNPTASERLRGDFLLDETWLD